MDFRSRFHDRVSGQWLPQWLPGGMPHWLVGWKIGNTCNELQIPVPYLTCDSPAVHVQYSALITWSIFSQILTKDTPLGLGMRCLLWIQHLMTFCLSSCNYLGNYLTILDRVITALNCICIGETDHYWGFFFGIQSSAAITRCNIVKYCIINCRKWGRISITCWIHKRHPIARPNGRAMGCLLLIFFRKLAAL